MIAEELEFQISQYVDGTLSVADRQALDEVLSADPRARKVLADYRKLNSHLLEMNAGPAVNWDRFADQISSQIHATASPAVAGRIGFFSMRVRIAAAVLVTTTAGIVAWRMHTPKPSAGETPVASSVVTGPHADIATGPGVADVSVGPSALAQGKDANRFGGVSSGVAPRPSKITIFGMNNPPAKTDSHLH